MDGVVRLGRILDGLSGALARVCEVALVALFAELSLILVATVVIRNAPWFSLSMAQTGELATFTFFWLVFLGAAVCWRRGQLISLTFAVSLLPENAGRVLGLVVDLAVLGFWLSLVWLGSDYAMRGHMQISANLKVPLSFGYSAIPVGTALLVLESVVRVLEHMVRLSGRAPMRVPYSSSEPSAGAGV